MKKFAWILSLLFCVPPAWGNIFPEVNIGFDPDASACEVRAPEKLDFGKFRTGQPAKDTEISFDVEVRCRSGIQYVLHVRHGNVYG
jgi:hypothetical protein